MDENPYKSPLTAGGRRAFFSWRIILAAAALLVLVVGLILPALKPAEEPVYRRWPAGLKLDDIGPAAERPPVSRPSP